MATNQRPNMAVLKRLPSLKPLRDITLTQIGQPQPSASPSASTSAPANSAFKPKFAPNLALAGKRVAAPTNSETHQSKKNPSRKSYFNTDNKRPKKEPVIIQSKGVFSEGFAEGSNSSKSTERSETFGRSRTAGASSGGGLRFGTAGSSGTGSRRSSAAASCSSSGAEKLDYDALESDETALLELMKDDFIADLAAGDNLPSSINVLMDDRKFKYQKMEFFDSVIRSVDALETEADSKLMTNLLFSDGDTDQSKNTSERIFLVQLPSVLSDMLSVNVKAKQYSKCSVKKEIKTEEPTENGVIEAEDESSTTVDSQQKEHVLQNVPEGCLGKLQILKSGKIRLKLDTGEGMEPIYMDVALATTSFAQELVQIQPTNSSEAGSMGCMNVISDDVRHRMIITPNVETISKELR